MDDGGGSESTATPGADGGGAGDGAGSKKGNRVKRLARYLAEKPESQESRAWRAFRAIRWAAAVVVVILAARASRQDICHVTATVRTGLATFSGLSRTEHVKACMPPGFDDLLSYFAIITVLLLPDARAVTIGGFQFERLTSKVEDVARDVGDLRQTVNTTINLSVSLISELRSAFQEQMRVLDPLRKFLPGDGATTSQLARVDKFADNLDRATVPSLLEIMNPLYGLVEGATKGAELAFARQAAEGDEDKQVVQADTVLREILHPDA